MSGSIAVIVGTRPELIKMAPVLKALQARGADFRFVHTGQHYDENMSEVFLRDLGLPKVDAFLSIGSGTHARQTADAMVKIEDFLLKEGCPKVLVQGDTNTVLAGALVGAKMQKIVGHVEAGLRSYDLRMPEEHNRVVADHLSRLLFAPTEKTADILRGEKVTGEVHMTGNTVIDAVNQNASIAERHAKVEIPDGDFALATAHRAENVDDPRILAGFVRVFLESPIPVVYPIHPRTVKMLKTHGLYDRLVSAPHVRLLPPQGYFDFLALMKRSRIVLTDSGGIQEEATASGIRKRVLVLRLNTERPEAVDSGFADIVGNDPDRILAAMREELASPRKLPSVSPFGDGRAGERIVDITLRA